MTDCTCGFYIDDIVNDPDCPVHRDIGPTWNTCPLHGHYVAREPGGDLGDCPACEGSGGNTNG